MPYFSCRSCHVVYQDYYPPDDTCINCHSGTIRLVREVDQQPTANIYSKEGTVTAIKPALKLITNQDTNSTSIQIESLTLVYKGNHYHLPGGTGDTIHVFAQSIATYVLTTNKGYGRMALYAFMVPQPDAINGAFLHTPQEIIDHLGHDWQQLPPEAIVEKLMDYLF
jgi:hypothetical protein